MSGCAALQVLYAITLIPAGLLADRVDRPRLLAGGLVAWSALTMVAAKVNLCLCQCGVQHRLICCSPQA